MSQSDGRVTLTDMSHNLSQELDRRRVDWQRDVERMQHAFFKVRQRLFIQSYASFTFKLMFMLSFLLYDCFVGPDFIYIIQHLS